MPKVPTYDDLQVSAQAGPSIRMTPIPAQNAAPQQAQNLGKGMMSFGGDMLRIQDQMDKTRVIEAVNSVVERKSDLKYNPDSGYLNLNGKAALERPDKKSLNQEYGEMLKKHGDELASGLGNNRQKAMFKQHLDRIALDFDGEINQHVATQSRNYELSVYKGQIDLAFKLSSSNWADAKAQESSLAALREGVLATGDLLGKSDEEIKSDILDATATMHTGVIAAAVDAHSMDYAKQYAKDHDKELHGDYKRKVVDLLDRGDRESKAKEQASAFIDTSKHVISNMPVLPGDLINVTEAKKQAVNVFKKSGMTLDGEQQMQLESYVEQIAADREREIKRGREVTIATAFAKLDKNGGDYQALLAENPWIANQPTEIKTRLNDYAGTVATGGTKATDWTAYNSLIDSPALLKEANIDAMRDKFNSREYNHLLKLKQELNQPGAEQNLVDNGPMVKQMLKDAGFESEEAQGQFRSLLQTAINQELEITQKKKLPQTRIKELAADLLVEEVTKKRSLWWDAKAAGFKVEVPDTERARIEAELQANGLPVNDYNVNQAYRSILRKQNGQ